VSREEGKKLWPKLSGSRLGKAAASECERGRDLSLPFGHINKRRSEMKRILVITTMLLMMMPVALAQTTERSSVGKPTNGKKPGGSSTTGPTNPKPPIGDLTAPSRDSKYTGGGCDTVADCKILKDACLKTPGYNYSPSKPDGSAGSCSKQSSKNAPGFSLNPNAGSGDLTSIPKTTGKATCSGAALCKNLKASCEKRGGDWKWLTPGTGGQCN
jgi:hypothetical protein